MRLIVRIRPLFFPALLTAVLLSSCAGENRGGRGVFAAACRPDNDIYQVLSKSSLRIGRYDSAIEAVNAAPGGSGVLVLADGYPGIPTPVEASVFENAREKNLRLYIEYPANIPGMETGEPHSAELERGVVTSGVFGGGPGPMSLLYIHGCRYIPVTAKRPNIVIAKVAGFDKAVYGLEGTEAFPILFEHPDSTVLIATTGLSHCITGRYTPADDWRRIWSWILGWLQPDADLPEIAWTPSVGPSYGKAEKLPDTIEIDALGRGIDWFFNARLLIHPEWESVYTADARTWPDRVGPMPERDWPTGNGSLGVLEGFSSRVDNAGYQKVRWWRRNDCNAEVTGAMALAGSAAGSAKYAETGANICDWLCFESMLSQGNRARKSHAAYGLFGWNDVEKYWRDLDGYGVYYGDDNARSLLGMTAAAAALETDRWDESIIRCILANFRTTGPLGFRMNRINEPDLVKNGWRHYYTSETISYAPHFQAYLWACYLWAYRFTGYAPLLDRAENAIRMTMEAYPGEWHWTNGIQQERARMLLPLSWLVRIDDTPEHRKWLTFMAQELLNHQDTCGAIREEIGPGRGRYGPPATNAEYGTNEASLIHENGDPVTDLLYTTNFAFLGLHEAAAATGDQFLKAAENRLAEFLCRIQVSSADHPEFDGAWFRAFDYDRWEHWASNSDAGWGVWSTETGWTQGWITAVLALRRLGTSLWDYTGTSAVGTYFEANRKTMLPEHIR